MKKCPRCGAPDTTKQRKLCTLEQCPLWRTQHRIDFTNAEAEDYEKVEADEKVIFYKANRSGKIVDG